MWKFQSTELAKRRGWKVMLQQQSEPVPYAAVIHAWQVDPDFRSMFMAWLADAPFTAYRWETPPVSTEMITRPFEFVLLDSPSLDRSPDPEAFGEHFAGAETDVVAFPNLGGDARLIVPTLVETPSAYGHLGAFVRYAPESQQHSFWKAIGDAMENRLGEKPVWLSTAGAGVAWLHVRLDDRPKYYGYSPYKDDPLAFS